MGNFGDFILVTLLPVTVVKYDHNFFAEWIFKMTPTKQANKWVSEHKLKKLYGRILNKLS